MVENGAAGGLEEDVGERVAGLGFFADLGCKVVSFILGFPKAVNKGKSIDESAVGAEGLLASAFELILFNEVPAIGAGAVLKQVGEGGASVAFGSMAFRPEAGEGSVVALDMNRCGLKGKQAYCLAISFHA